MPRWTRAPSSYNASDYLTSWKLNTEVRDRLLALRYLQDYVAVLQVPTTGQWINDKVYTPIAWKDSVINYGGLWSSQSSPTRVTAPVPGYYHVSGLITWSTGSTAGLRYSEIRKNGNDSSAYKIVGTEPSLYSYAGCENSFSEMFYLASGDYLEITVLHTVTDEKPQLIAGGPNNGSWLSVRLAGATF